jgi:hypothetical protein
MNTLHRIARRIPGVPEAYHLLRHLYVRHRSKRLNRNVVFAELFHGNGWNGKQSASGTGSDADQTAVLVRELPALLRRIINEQCTEVGGAFSDKSLALWRIQDIAAFLKKRSGPGILGRAAAGMLNLRRAARTNPCPC